jgi:hypothetical protein
MSVDFRAAHKKDLPFIVKTEQKASTGGFVLFQSPEEHEGFYQMGTCAL